MTNFLTFFVNIFFNNFFTIYNSESRCHMLKDYLSMN